jgi:hypothetical protein
LLQIPEAIIYAFKNENPFGIELQCTIAEIANKEILGPEGKISNEQIFHINENSQDVFIVRGVQQAEMSENQMTKFKIKSIIGRKYSGLKNPQPNYKNLKEKVMVIQEIGELSEMEKTGEKGRAGLYDTLSNGMKFNLAGSEIKVKLKKEYVGIKKEDCDDILDLDEVVQMKNEVDRENERILMEKEKQVKKLKEIQYEDEEEQKQSKKKKKKKKEEEEKEKEQEEESES